MKISYILMIIFIYKKGHENCKLFGLDEKHSEKRRNLKGKIPRQYKIFINFHAFSGKMKIYKKENRVFTFKFKYLLIWEEFRANKLFALNFIAGYHFFLLSYSFSLFFLFPLFHLFYN